MLQQTEPRKYQIFPPKEKVSLASGRKTPDWDSTSASSYKSLDKDRSKLVSNLRLKTKDQPLLRRRKISITEIGAMTTVQEIPMDSRELCFPINLCLNLSQQILATVPGRPPIHERSSSAPGNSWRQHVFGDTMISGVSGPVFNESNETVALNAGNTQGQTSDCTSATTKALEPPVQKLPLSPKSLAPLIIPSSSAPLPRLAEQESKGDETPGPDVPPKSARMLEFSSPIRTLNSKAPAVPTPISSVVATSTFASKQHAKQPLSAPSGRSSPQPWSAISNSAPYSQARSQTPDNKYVFSHRRGASEGANAIMDRGRPKKRTEMSPTQRMYSASVTESVSEERKAFEALPKSYIPTAASASMPADEINALRKQAIGQAARFGVLSAKDVDMLSKVIYLPTSL